MDPNNWLVINKDKVRKQWGKSELERKECIQILKDWLQTQKHLPEIPGENMIEYFLINCKYSIETTKQTLDMYYTSRKLFPEFYYHPLKPEQELVYKMIYLVTLPEPTEKMHRITFVKYLKEGEDIFDPYKALAHGYNMFEVRLHEDLVMGEIIIADLSEYSMVHAAKSTPTLMKKCVIMMEKLYRNRLKEFHMINVPPFIESVLSIAKVIVKKKMFDRIHLHTDLESLYKFVPQHLLPIEYGGKQKSLQELAKMWQLKFKQYEKRFDELENLEINESLRPEPLCNSDYLGFYGNFRKIEVD